MASYAGRSWYRTLHGEQGTDYPTRVTRMVSEKGPALGHGFGELSMRHIVGLLSVMLTCFALTTLHAAAASIEGSWIGSGTVSHRGNVDRVQCRVRYTKLRKELRNIIGLYNREWQIRD